MTRAIATYAMRTGKPLGFLVGVMATALALAVSVGCDSEPANVPGSIKADKKSLQIDPFANDAKTSAKEQVKDRTKNYDQAPDKK